MLYNNHLWIEDIDTVSRVVPEVKRLAGMSLLITGATGLICSAIIDILFRYNDTHADKISILAAGRSEKKMRSRFGDMVDRPDFTFIQYDATAAENVFHHHADYIIHGASNAYPEMVMKEPVETMLSNFQGLKELLDYANANGTKRVLYISSSEVYGKKDGSKPYRENEYGFVDLLNPRSSYSVGKRAAETLCMAYAEEYGVEAVIVRPGHIYGPTATEKDTRVSSAWAFDAARGKDIVMKSDGSQIRSYCYCLDCASAILKVLLIGNNLHAYNISNPDSIITIRDMAEILTKVAGVTLKAELPSESEKKGYNPMDNSSLESFSLTDIGWRGCFDAKIGFEHTVKILKDLVINK